MVFAPSGALGFSVHQYDLSPFDKNWLPIHLVLTWEFFQNQPPTPEVFEMAGFESFRFSQSIQSGTLLGKVSGLDNDFAWQGIRRIVHD